MNVGDAKLAANDYFHHRYAAVRHPLAISHSLAWRSVGRANSATGGCFPNTWNRCPLQCCLVVVLAFTAVNFC